MKCKNYLLNLLENIPLWYEDVQVLQKYISCVLILVPFKTIRIFHKESFKNYLKGFKFYLFTFY